MFHQQSVFTILIVLIALSGAYKSYKNYKVYSVHARNENDLNLLRSLELNLTGVDFWDHVHHVTNTSYRVMVPPAENEQFAHVLRKNKLKARTIIDNVADLELETKSKRKCCRKFDFNHFWSYDEVDAYLDYLSLKYANYTKISAIGESGEGRKIRSIHITGHQLKENPQTILVDATIHAREWIATMVAVYIISELVEKRAKNLNSMLNINWVVVPIVNPDGYVFAHENDRFWRKTRTIIDNTKCSGIDPNRNFDFHWDTPGASGIKPCGETYRGPKANFLPEVQNLCKLFIKYPNTKLYLTLHSYGGYILYPYGYDEISLENYREHDKLGKRVRDQIFKYSGSVGKKYRVGNSAKLLYPASGGSDDYAVGVAKIPFAFTIELPGGGSAGFDIPASRINSVVKETFAGIKEFANFFANKE